VHGAECFVTEILLLRINWNGTAVDQRIASRFYNLAVAPEPDYPFGRKGLALASAWRQLATAENAGMLLLDGDVVIDPEDYGAMRAAIHVAPDIVHVAPVRLWPTSTKRKDWVWGHWTKEASQELEDDAWWFTFSFTYLPLALIERAIKEGLRTWRYPTCDRRVCEEAQAMAMKVHVVPNCWPKHTNY
jgi:hypothetical protein